MFDSGGRGGKDSDDDDDFFRPSATGGKSTLAKIFGISSKSTTQSSEQRTGSTVAPKTIKISDRYGPSNFRYIPSQSGDVESPPPEDTGKAPEWAIVRATVVTAYKLADGDNVFLGKVGLALLKSSSGHRLLLYRSKTDVLGTLTFTPGVRLFLKQDYLQFRTDDTSDFWSVLFDGESDRQAMLALLDSSCCTIDREPLVEEPLSEAEKEPDPPSPTRSNLVARMARMGGQAMPLPERAKTSAAAAPPPPIPTSGPGSDSSDTSDSKIETISTRPVRRAPNSLHPAIGMQMVPLTGMVAAGGNAPTGHGPPGMADVNFNLVMSETRMQNTEMRMNLTKLESKLDRVLDRIDLLNLQGTGTDRPPATVAEREAEVLALEEKLLELKRENHSLRSKVRALEATQADGKRTADAKLEQKLQAMEVQERRLKSELASWQHKVEESCAEQERAAEKLLLVEKQLQEAKETTERYTKDVQSAVDQLKGVQAARDRLKLLLSEETSRSTDAKTLIELLRKENDTLQHTIAIEKERQPPPSSGSLVKEIMNNCYQQLCGQITDPQVLRTIAQTIKRETKAALEREQTK